MNDLQSRWDIHVELEDLNAEAAKLAAVIKYNVTSIIAAKRLSLRTLRLTKPRICGTSAR